MGILDNGRPVHGRPVQIREERVPVPDQSFLSLLSADEQRKIRDEALKQIEEERKSKAREQFMRLAIQEARSAFEPDEEMVDIYIDLAGHSKQIVLDMGDTARNGGVYYHGHTYTVKASVNRTLMEIMARGWAHEEETGIPNHKFYRRPAFIGTNYGDPGGRLAALSPTIGNKDLGRPAESILHAH